MTIVHNTFGEGRIAEIDTSMTDARLIVEFANTGRKVLLLKFARFEIVK